MSRKSFVAHPMQAAGAVVASIVILSGMTLHHGWSNYHQDIELTYEGTITSNDIGNPHTYIDLEVIRSDEETAENERAQAYADIEEWNVVLAPLSRMRSRGVTDDAMLAVGDVVTVVGYPHRSVEQEMRAERIIIGDLTVELR